MTSKMQFKKPLIIFSLLAAASISQAADLSVVPAGKYEVDPTHAYINFSYNHLGLSNPKLGFDDFTVDLDLDNTDPTQSSIAVNVDIASVITGSEVWTDHLTGEKWLDAAAFPSMTFQSTAVEAAGDGAYKVTGDLTVKDVTKPIELSVSINAAMNHPMSGDPVVGLDASGTLLRSDFGLGGAAPAVSDEVALEISVEMAKSAE